MVVFLDAATKRHQFAAMVEAVPLKATGQPEHAAHSLIEASFVTGTILPVDGGFTLA